MSDYEGTVPRLTALSPESIRTGAVVSFSGDTLVESGEGIVAAVQARLADSASSGGRPDDWLTDAVPVLARGSVWIVPLAWVPTPEGQNAAEHRTLNDRVGELWSAVRGACWYRHGDQIGIDLEAPAGERTRYASELGRSGVRRADWWAFGESAVVLAVSGDPIPAPISMMALHVVPVGWVSERRPTPPKKMPGLDLSWSWSDVIALNHAGYSEQRREEGQG